MNFSKLIKHPFAGGGRKSSLLVGASAVFGTLVAAVPSSVPAWIDINAQIPARTDMASGSVAFTTNADGHGTDEEIGGIWTMNTMVCGTMVIFR